MPDKKFKKICSSCGSENLKSAVTPWMAYAAPLSGYFKCLDCGFEGGIIEVEEKQAEKIREKLKSRKNNKK